MKENPHILIHFHCKTSFLVALWLQNKDVEIVKLEYLVQLVCSSVHLFKLASAAVTYLWEPNGSLPQAVSICGEQASRELRSCNAPLSL